MGRVPRLLRQAKEDQLMELAEIDKRFTYHQPGSQQVAQRHELVRREVGELAAYLNEILPESREKALAFTALEEALMWSNAAIARNQS